MIDEATPRTIFTDSKRLQQVLKNLLSNAFKFTEQGEVRLVDRAGRGRLEPAGSKLDRADQVIAFVVADTGVGIPAAKQQIIFEAFQQADGTTSRRYGGPGSASRSAGRSRACSAASSGSPASPGGAARSRCTCPGSTRPRPRPGVRVATGPRGATTSAR